MKKKERNAIIISIIFLVGGLGILWFIDTMLGIEGEAVPVFMLLMPVLIYMIMSGKIKELKGPGGLEAVFNTPVDEFVDTSDTITGSIGNMTGVNKGTMFALQENMLKIDESKPFYLSLKPGSIRYSDNTILYYIERLSKLRSFKFVIFLDQNDRYIGFIPYWILKNILHGFSSNDEAAIERAGDFIDALNDKTNRYGITDFPEVIDELIYPDFTYSQALRKMRDLNIEALVVVNKDRTVKGLVERDQLISEMILKSQE